MPACCPAKVATCLFPLVFFIPELLRDDLRGSRVLCAGEKSQAPGAVASADSRSWAEKRSKPCIRRSLHGARTASARVSVVNTMRADPLPEPQLSLRSNVGLSDSHSVHVTQFFQVEFVLCFPRATWRHTARMLQVAFSSGTQLFFAGEFGLIGGSKCSSWFRCGLALWRAKYSHSRSCA